MASLASDRSTVTSADGGEDDRPLDRFEMALVRALARAIVRELAREREGRTDPPPSSPRPEVDR